MPHFFIRGIVASAAACQLASALGLGEHELVAHLKQKSLTKLEDRFWDVANPESKSYLQHSSVEELASLIGASDEEIAEASNWLVSLGADASTLRVSNLRDTVSASFSPKNEANTFGASLKSLSEKRPASVEFVVRRDAHGEDLKASSPQPKKATSNLTDAYTISNIKDSYGIPTKLVASNPKTLQMVWGPGTFGYSAMQLRLLKWRQCPLLDLDKIKYDTSNHGQAGGDNFGEGNLDVQMISTFGLGVETLVSNTNASASTEEGYGFGQALLDFITELSQRKTVPQVLSMSLGSLSAASCDMLCEKASKMGHSEDECKKYIQTQRQVCMLLSTAQQTRINTAFQVLGLRGVSIFGSSGDGGSHFSFGKFTGGAIADTLNKISCEFQMPVFPTTSPYITSVGGTMWEGDAKHPITWAGFGGGSGGGFSWQFDMPEHQKKAVASYLANTTGLPSATSFNKNGRAYPDVSAIAVEGTSQSCPIMAGIFSMIMDDRLNKGLPPLGFVAPRIWKLAQQYPGQVFQDISKGNSKTSCDNGFPSVANSWDANTGWGIPVWEGMKKHLASDPPPARKREDAIVV